MTKTILVKKKCKKAKSFSKEALHTTEKRREVKGKRERERYTQLNVELQRIARRDKKVFFNEQCKEIIEENSRRKARNLFMKVEIPKEYFMQELARLSTETIRT